MMSQSKGLDPFQMLMEGADRLGDAAVKGVGALVGFGVQQAPSALGAAAGATGDLVTSVANIAGTLNENVREATSGLGQSPQNTQFASLLSGCDLGALRGCTMEEKGSQLGELSAPLTNLVPMRVQGNSMAI